MQAKGNFAMDSWLAENTALPSSNRKRLAALLPVLADQIDTEHKTTVGISGAPGSGKSTLARALVQYLALEKIPACLVSLDDYYLGRERRKLLAKSLHPLFGQRGAPGSHELDRLLADLDLLRNGWAGAVQLPVFDKSTDDRAPKKQWKKQNVEPRTVILEGWCVGAPPQQYQQIETPVNEMERTLDRDGKWRGEMLRQWRRMYHALSESLDQVWYIRVPGWDCVVDWRWRQEQQLARKNLNSRFEVEKFLGSFERIVNHMQNSYPEWADQVLELDRHHDIKLTHRNGSTT
jgi:D-glycerate 3-kinase